MFRTTNSSRFSLGSIDLILIHLFIHTPRFVDSHFSELKCLLSPDQQFENNEQHISQLIEVNFSK